MADSGATKEKGDQKRLAEQLWGGSSSCLEIVEGVQLFDCAAHGGFIVNPKAFDSSKIPGVAAYEKKLPWMSDAYYVFEEDCDWAVLFLHYPELAEAHYAHLKSCGGLTEYKAFADFYAYVAELVAVWSPANFVASGAAEVTVLGARNKEA